MTGVGGRRYPRHPQQGLPEGGGRLARPRPPSQQDSAPRGLCSTRSWVPTLYLWRHTWLWGRYSQGQSKLSMNWKSERPRDEPESLVCCVTLDKWPNLSEPCRIRVAVCRTLGRCSLKRSSPFFCFPLRGGFRCPTPPIANALTGSFSPGVLLPH